MPANDPVRQVLWWLCLVMAPAILAGMELFHPSGFTNQPGMYEFLSHSHGHDPQYWALAYFGPNWWLTLHMIQTPVVGLVSVGLWLTVGGIGREDGAIAWVLSWLARASIFVFLIYYTVLDSVGGIGLGRSILTVQNLVADGKLSQAQFEGAVLLLNTLWLDPIVGGVGSFVSLTGPWAVLFASIFIAAALAITGRAPWPALLLLLGFGWQLYTSHASLHGPIAFGLLIVASLWMWWWQGRQKANPVERPLMPSVSPGP